jgi:hypothetical protein
MLRGQEGQRSVRSVTDALAHELRKDVGPRSGSTLALSHRFPALTCMTDARPAKHSCRFGRYKSPAEAMFSAHVVGRIRSPKKGPHRSTIVARR